jgi:hypothetical protein
MYLLQKNLVLFYVAMCSGQPARGGYIINNRNYYHSVTNEVAGEQYICGGTRHD